VRSGEPPPARAGVGLELLDDVHRKRASLGYWLACREWGRGYATEAVAAVCRYAFATFDLERLAP
jgi:RimJ/RimL family protein N-acetyltransferase